jgi:hypothetical protein
MHFLPRNEHLKSIVLSFVNANARLYTIYGMGSGFSLRSLSLIKIKLATIIRFADKNLRFLSAIQEEFRKPIE